MSVEVSQLVKTYRRSTGDMNFISRFRSFIKRDYQTVRALDNISFSVKAGEKSTVIGPNGAGKSTIIKILTGIIQMLLESCYRKV